MAEHQLLHRAVADIVQIKPAAIGFDAGMENHLHHHVAQFFLHQLGIIGVDGLAALVNFLQKIPADGVMGLHPIPRAALGRAQQTNHFHKIFISISGFLRKINHIFHAFAMFYARTRRIFAIFSPAGSSMQSS